MRARHMKMDANSWLLWSTRKNGQNEMSLALVPPASE